MGTVMMEREAMMKYHPPLVKKRTYTGKNRVGKVVPIIFPRFSLDGIRNLTVMRWTFPSRLRSMFLNLPDCNTYFGTFLTKSLLGLVSGPLEASRVDLGASWRDKIK